MQHFPGAQPKQGAANWWPFNSFHFYNIVYATFTPKFSFYITSGHGFEIWLHKRSFCFSLLYSYYIHVSSFFAAMFGKKLQKPGQH